VVYVSSNYSDALAYQCLDVNPRSGACRHALAYVMSRSRDVSQSALDDVVQHVDHVSCLRPSDLRLVSHEGLLPADVLCNCKVCADWLIITQDNSKNNSFVLNFLGSVYAKVMWYKFANDLCFSLFVECGLVCCWYLRTAAIERNRDAFFQPIFPS